AFGLRLQGQDPRRLRRGLADLLRGPGTLLRQGRPLPRRRRPQGEPAPSARQPLPAHDAAESLAGAAAAEPEEDEPRAHAVASGGTGKHYEAKGKAVVLAASALESARLLMLSKSNAHPNGIGNSSGHVGHNFCEHVMGPSILGRVKDLVGKPRTLDDGRPG